MKNVLDSCKYMKRLWIFFVDGKNGKVKRKKNSMIKKILSYISDQIAQIISKICKFNR